MLVGISLLLASNPLATQAKQTVLMTLYYFVLRRPSEPKICKVV